MSAIILCVFGFSDTMQPTLNDDSLSTETVGSRAQPTREQEEYAGGFEAALAQIYAQRGVPMVVDRRSQQSTASDLILTVHSNSSSLLTAACTSGQSTPAASAVQTGVGPSNSAGFLTVPVAVTDLMISPSRNPVPQPSSSSSDIPLCVARLTSIDFDQNLITDSDQKQQQPPSCDRNSTGIQATVYNNVNVGIFSAVRSPLFVSRPCPTYCCANAIHSVIM